jgi:hypothetical protein
MAVLAGVPYVRTPVDRQVTVKNNRGPKQGRWSKNIWNTTLLDGGRIAVAQPTPSDNADGVQLPPRGRPVAHAPWPACPGGHGLIVDSDMAWDQLQANTHHLKSNGYIYKYGPMSGARYDCWFSFYERCRSTVLERRAIYQQHIIPLLLPSVLQSCTPEIAEDSVVVHLRDGDVANDSDGEHAQPPCVFYNHAISTGFGGKPFRRVRLVHSMSGKDQSPCMKMIVAQHSDKLVVPTALPSLAEDKCLLQTARNLVLSTSSFGTCAMMMNRNLQQLFVMNTIDMVNLTIPSGASARHERSVVHHSLDRTELCAALPRVVYYRLAQKRYHLLDEDASFTVSTCGNG